MNLINQNFLTCRKRLESQLGEPIFVSGLCHQYQIFQRKNGHRHSIDDAITAWYALQKAPNSRGVLDLGAGIGSVGLGVICSLGPEASLVCVEAQKVSYDLLRANIECNGLNSRVTSIFGDLRDLRLDQKFPLVTGSPPYFPSGTGILPEDAQKAYARFELRGDLSDYARTAEAHLEDDGIFVFCFPFQQKARCFKLIGETNLRIRSVKDVIPRRSKSALFSVYAASRHDDGILIEEPALVVANEDGRYSEDMLAIQRSRGFGPEGSNVKFGAI